MKRLIAISGFFTLAVFSHVVFAASPSPGAGWVPGISPTGQTIWFGPGTATKASTTMGQAIWESATGSATGAKLTTTAKLAVGAGEAAVVAKGVITGANVFAAVKLLAMGGTGVVGIGMTALTMAPMVVDYFTGPTVKLGPLSARDSSKPFLYRPDIQKIYWESPYGVTGFQDALSACKNEFPTTASAPIFADGKYAMCSSAGGDSFGQARSYLGGGPQLDWMPASMDDIAPYMDKPVTPAQIQAIVDAGATLPITSPSVTGPATVTLPSVVSVTNDGTNTTTSTKTTKSTQTYSSGSPSTGEPVVPKVSSTTNTSTVITVVNNTTGATTTTTNNTNNPGTLPKPDEKPEDACKDNPDSVGCAELDTPEGEIPKSSKNITYTPQTPFGGGSCPADKYQTLHTGQVLKVVDWATPCGYIADYVRPVLILLGSWMAMMLLIPGRTES